MYVQSVFWLEYVCSPELRRFSKCTSLHRHGLQSVYGLLSRLQKCVISPLHHICDTDIASPQTSFAAGTLG